MCDYACYSQILPFYESSAICQQPSLIVTLMFAFGLYLSLNMLSGHWTRLSCTTAYQDCACMHQCPKSPCLHAMIQDPGPKKWRENDSMPSLQPSNTAKTSGEILRSHILTVVAFGPCLPYALPSKICPHCQQREDPALADFQKRWKSTPLGNYSR